MRRPGARTLVVVFALASARFGCGAGEGAAQPRERTSADSTLLGSWAPCALPPPSGERRATNVLVGGRSVPRTMGLATSGAPALSVDGAWAAWTGSNGVLVREVRTGATREVPIPAGLEATRAAFFGDGRELGVAMERALPEGTEEHLLVVYGTADLEIVHAMSTREPFQSCSILRATQRELLCVVDPASETHPSYVLAIAPSTHAVRTVRLATTTGVGAAVASQDATHLYYATRRSPAPGRSVIVDLDLARGRERELTAPTTGVDDHVTGLAVDPRGAHLAVGTFYGGVSLHALPGGRLLRRAPPYDSERQSVGVSADLTLWDDRPSLTAHRPGRAAQRLSDPCGHFGAFQDTGTELVIASYESLCVFDRQTLALDPARSTVVGGERALWHGDEIVTISSALTPNDVPAPRVVRRNVSTGALSAVEETYAARNAVLGVAAVLPPALAGEPQPRSPFIFEMSGDRAIVTLPGELAMVLYDPSAARAIAPISGPAIFLAGGAQLLEAAFAPRDAARNRGLVLRSSRDGGVVRTIRPLTLFAQRILVAPDERHALVTYERRAELVTLATGATTVLHEGLVFDASIRGDGRELALSVFCRDQEPCTTRVLRMALPSGVVVATLDSRERVRPAYAPSNDAIALVHAAGVVIQPLARGWTSGAVRSAVTPAQ